MQFPGIRTFVRKLLVCTCIAALALAGANAAVDLRKQEAKDRSDALEAEKGGCPSGPTTAGPIPLELRKECGLDVEVAPDEMGEKASSFVQLGPIILQLTASATAGSYNTGSIPTITSLPQFASFTIPTGSFPADVEILPSDPVHVYELMNTGAVRKYTTAGVSSAVSTVTPPAGLTWLDTALDPTTGTVYATAGNSTCTATTLATVDLLTGAHTVIGAVTNGACALSLAADNSGNLFAFDIALDNVISVNKATGAGTILGPAGFNGQFGQGADCDPATGTCYLFAFNNTAFRAELRSINTATGATTLINPIGSVLPGGTVQASGAVFGTFGICQVNADCNDNNACNGLETCDTGSGNCLPGTPVSCSDGDVCTLDNCDPATGSCSFPPNPCSDGDPCTADSCDPVNGCQHSTPGLVRLCNSGAITIPSSGAGTPYPSDIVAGGLSTSASLCSIELRGLSHTFPDDIDVLLEGPVAPTQNAIVMSDVGGSADAVGVDFVLTDGAAGLIPDAGPLVSGSFRPTNVGTGDTFPAPAPAPSAATNLSGFSGNPNGTWRLYVVDDAGGDLGSFAGGWCINLVQSACTNDAGCDDGNLCNGVETCVSGLCQPGTPVNCDDGNFCTVDSCVPATGTCTYAPNPCSDGDGCTQDSCDPVTGCSHILQTPVQFCSSGAITIPSSGNGTPYPSTIPVSGLPSQASLCSVTLRSISHTFPDDIDILLVGPAGGAQNSIILSDAGGSADAVGVDLLLKDSAAAVVPDGGPMVSGTFKPTNFVTGDTFPAPAPAPAPGTASLQVFTGNPNGNWDLFVRDDAGGDLGSIGAWCVGIVLQACDSDADCNDGNVCNGLESCVNTECVPGTPVDCSDGNPCTVDNCNPGDGSCFYTDTDCNDGNGCTADFCDPSTGCGHADNCQQFCNTGAITLNDGTAPPTTASPYPSDIAVSVPPGPGIVTVANVRLNGLSHTFPDDLDILVAGPTGANVILMSDAGGSGDITNVNLVLTDGAAANISDAGPLVSGTFRPFNYEATVDNWPAPAPPAPRGLTLATFNGLNPNGNWSLYSVDDANIDGGSLNGGWCIDILVSCSTNADCNDGDACTADACVQGQCENTGISCDDGNGCTNDSCDPASGCVYTDNTDPCSDGNACTENDTCGGGSCQPGGDVDCDDGNGCTDDSCDPASGCVYTDNTDPCEDGNACTAGDTCGGGSCQPGGPVTCDDGTLCTADSCDPATGCVYTPVDGIEPNPHTRGYWKRLCIGPHSGDELTAGDAACVAGQGSHFAGVSTVDDICAVLNSSGSQCTQGEVELMVTALNLCHVLLCEATPIDSQYSDNGTVGDNYADAEANLGSGGDCGLSHHLGSEVNTGRAISVDTVAFAKLAGGGARLNWTAMGGGTAPVTKYNVWRRQAGSLAAFSKIGETTTLSFDDTTPGKFEYEVTPVR